MSGLVAGTIPNKSPCWLKAILGAGLTVGKLKVPKENGGQCQGFISQGFLPLCLHVRGETQAQRKWQAKTWRQQCLHPNRPKRKLSKKALKVSYSNMPLHCSLWGPEAQVTQEKGRLDKFSWNFSWFLFGKMLGPPPAPLDKPHCWPSSTGYPCSPDT